MENYIASLEKEFSLIENGFKEEEKRALSDYRSNDKEFVKKLAFLAYNSNTYQVRMYGVFLFGYLSEQNDILTFMRDEVSKDDNWRVQAPARPVSDAEPGGRTGKRSPHLYQGNPALCCH